MNGWSQTLSYPIYNPELLFFSYLRGIISKSKNYLHPPYILYATRTFSSFLIWHFGSFHIVFDFISACPIYAVLSWTWFYHNLHIVGVKHFNHDECLCKKRGTGNIVISIETNFAVLHPCLHWSIQPCSCSSEYWTDKCQSIKIQILKKKIYFDKFDQKLF